MAPKSKWKHLFFHKPIFSQISPKGVLPDPVGPIRSGDARRVRSIEAHQRSPVVFLTREEGSREPLVLTAADLAHPHDVARALEGFGALVYIDAVEADGNYLTTKARSRLIHMRFKGH